MPVFICPFYGAITVAGSVFMRSAFATLAIDGPSQTLRPSGYEGEDIHFRVNLQVRWTIRHRLLLVHVPGVFHPAIEGAIVRTFFICLSCAF